MNVLSTVITELGPGQAGVIADGFVRDYMLANHPRIMKKVAEEFGCEREAAVDVIALVPEINAKHKKHVNKAWKNLLEGDAYSVGVFAQTVISRGMLHKLSSESQEEILAAVEVLAEDVE